MILTQLKELAETQMNLPPEMYSSTKVAWFIDITPEGKFLGVIARGGTKDKNAKQSQLMMVPQLIRTSGIKPKLLADNAQYTLGIPQNSSKTERVEEYHTQFIDLVKECAEVTQEVTVKAIERFLDSAEDVQEAKNHLLKDKTFNPADVITFRVNGIIPANGEEGHREIEKFWAKHTVREDDNPTMMCLVTGEIGPVVKGMPKMIKGLIGGQSSGTALVSANAANFTSYGLDGSLTSPMSREAAEKCLEALNHLIASKESRRHIGSTTYVCWTCVPEDGWNPLEFMDKPDPQAVQNLLESPFTGKQAHSLEVNHFYALALTANNARVVIRDWIHTTLKTVRDSLTWWFQAQSIVDAYGQPGRPLGIYTLAASVYRDAAKEMQPAITNALVRVALYGGRLPENLLTRAIGRNRVEHDVPFPRAALIKLILTTHNPDAMTNMNTLNPNPNLEGADRTAYYCGRLLAELEALQRAAIGQVKASLTDRYYGAASSTPASAFPSLMRGARAHFAKLRKDKPTTYSAIEQRMEEITQQIPTFPKTLKMQQQGLFALGYYHQRAANRAAAQGKNYQLINH